MIVNTKFRVIAAGLVAAILSQYAWLIPIPQAYLTFCVVAFVCMVVAAILMAVDRG